MKRKILCALLIASIASTHAFADSVTGMPAVTAFSYQGQLEAAGTLANGVYQFTFTLYTAANGGMPVGGTFPIHQQIIVVDGVFTTDQQAVLQTQPLRWCVVEALAAPALCPNQFS